MFLKLDSEISLNKEKDIIVDENADPGDRVAIARSPYNLKVGFTCGAFDLLHAGHVLMLKEAREQCDYLIVGVQSDPSIDRDSKNKPIQTYEERILMVRSIRYIDEVVLYNTENDLVNLIKKLAPDIRILGVDWEGKMYTGHGLTDEVYFNQRDHSWSTSELRKRVYHAERLKLEI